MEIQVAELVIVFPVQMNVTLLLLDSVFIQLISVQTWQLRLHYIVTFKHAGFF